MKTIRKHLDLRKQKPFNYKLHELYDQSYAKFSIIHNVFSNVKFLKITALFTTVCSFNQAKCSATYVVKTEKKFSVMANTFILFC